MKQSIFILGLFALVFGACNNNDVNSTPELTSASDSFSYYYGLLVGQDIDQAATQNFDDINMDLVVKGFTQAILSDTLSADMKQVESFVMNRINEIRMQQAMESAAAAPSLEQEQGIIEEWIASNGDRGDYAVAPEGYYYKVITEGSGDHPTEASQVKVHYTGTLLDGTVFDSSVERGEPAVFGLNQVIPGWTKGLQLMTPGSKYQLVLPSSLAYGPREAGSIPANSILVFEVELLEIL